MLEFSIGGSSSAKFPILEAILYKAIVKMASITVDIIVTLLYCCVIELTKELVPLPSILTDRT